MNLGIISGRLTKDPETRNTQSGVAVCSFTVAVDRAFKDANGQKQADFIPCVAWRKQAEFVQSYFKKGGRIEVVGSIQTRNWDDAEGRKHYATEIVVDQVHFGESKRQDDGYQPRQSEPTQTDHDQFNPSVDDTALPFEL